MDDPLENQIIQEAKQPPTIKEKRPFLKYALYGLLTLVAVSITLILIWLMLLKVQNGDANNNLYVERLQALYELKEVVAKDYEAKVWENKEDNYTLNYRYKKPKIEGTYPLVVALHCSWGRSSDNYSQIANCGLAWELVQEKNYQKYPAFIIAPQCPAGDRWKNPVIMKCVFQLIDHVVKTESIDESRIYIGGESLGGYGSLKYALHRPDMFAASFICSAWSPQKDLSSIAHIPIWIFHGTDDLYVPLFLSNSIVKSLKKDGGEPKQTIFQDLGHISWFKAFDEHNVIAWMFSQSKKNNQKYRYSSLVGNKP